MRLAYSLVVFTRLISLDQSKRRKRTNPCIFITPRQNIFFLIVCIESEIGCLKTEARAIHECARRIKSYVLRYKSFVLQSLVLFGAKSTCRQDCGMTKDCAVYPCLVVSYKSVAHSCTKKGDKLSSDSDIGKSMIYLMNFTLTSLGPERGF